MCELRKFNLWFLCCITYVISDWDNTSMLTITSQWGEETRRTRSSYPMCLRVEMSSMVLLWVEGILLDHEMRLSANQGRRRSECNFRSECQAVQDWSQSNAAELHNYQNAGRTSIASMSKYLLVAASSTVLISSTVLFENTDQLIAFLSVLELHFPLFFVESKATSYLLPTLLHNSLETH